VIAAPPRRPPQPDELEALIEEARQRARRRRVIIGVSILVAAVVAGSAIGAYYLATTGGSRPATAQRAAAPPGLSHKGDLVLWGTLWGRASVYAVRPDGTHFRRLLTMDDTNEIPALSPDGSRIVFAQELPRRHQGRGLHYLDLASGRIADVPDSADAGEPQWSPDGTRIVYRICDPTRRCALWSLQPDGADRRLLSAGLNPFGPGAISPDSRWIAFLSLDDSATPFHEEVSGDLYVERLEGSERRVVSESAGNPISWTRTDLLVRNESGLVAISLSGEERPFLNDVADVAASPDGQWLAYTHGRDGSVRLSIARTDGDGPESVYTSRPAPDIYPLVWSSDSRGLAFTASERHSRTLVTVVNPSRPDDASTFRVFHVVRPLGWSVTAARSRLVAGPVSCRPGAFRVSIALNGATGALVGSADLVSHWAACHLDVPLRFSVRGPTGALVHGIRGNPADARLRGTLTPTNPIGQSWAWRNWCGRGGLVFEASARGRTAIKRVQPPRCDSAQAPSTLTPFGP